jgi:hypothetical protein
MAQEQVEVELRNEMQQLQHDMQQQMASPQVTAESTEWLNKWHNNCKFKLE